MEMVKKVWLLLVLAAAGWSCEAEFADEQLANKGVLTENSRFYFLDASLQFGSDESVLPLSYFVDLDPDTPAGLNEFLVATASPFVEVYSVFNEGSSMLDDGPGTTARLEALEDQFGFTYGSVSYAGLGFGFFLPSASSNAGFAHVHLDSMLQASNTLEFGTQPGQVEIGYYKNFPGFENDERQGFVTNSASNENGIFTIEGVWPATDINGQAGYQLHVTFNTRLFKQYRNEHRAELEGTAVIFVPEP
jgi:hypothetical protein